LQTAQNFQKQLNLPGELDSINMHPITEMIILSIKIITKSTHKVFLINMCLPVADDLLNIIITKQVNIT